MKIITIGETTYDIFFKGGKPVGVAVGGSQLNSAISLSRCGLPVCFVSSAGDDCVGDISVDFLSRNGVNIEYISRYEGNSRIALAFFNDRGDASYSFYPAAKTIIPNYPKPQLNDIILFGSSFAIREEGRDELIEFLQLAKEFGAIIIYDPNIRKDVDNNTGMKEMVLQNMGFSTIVKGSVEDFIRLFKTSDEEKIYSEIVKIGANFLVCTKGAEGVSFFSPGFRLSIPAIPVSVVSTVGAGDNFSAGIIFRLYKYFNEGFSINDLSKEMWHEIMKSATKFSAEVCASEENYISAAFASKL
jgi:fructokinase